MCHIIDQKIFLPCHRESGNSGSGLDDVLRRFFLDMERN